MRGLLWLLAAFALAAGLSVLLRGNDGYVLVVLPPWRMEMSLAFVAVMLAGTFLVLHLLVRAVQHTLGLPSHVRAFRERQREQKGRKALAGAVTALAEGRYGHAERLAGEASDAGFEPQAAALLAARAAHRMRNAARRDAWLERLAELGTPARDARLALQAEALLDERRFDEARAALRELHDGGARHISTLLLLLRAEQALGNWDEVVRLARLLEKRGAMPAEAVEGSILAARSAQLSARAGDAGQLLAFWRGLPERERVQPRVAAAAARAFMSAGQPDEAQRAVEESLAQGWDAGLAMLYGRIEGGDARSRLERAERWLPAQPRDADLLLTLGLLCLRASLWGKAQNYLEASLSISEAPATRMALAELAERTGRSDEATRQVRRAAEAGATRD